MKIHLAVAFLMLGVACPAQAMDLPDGGDNFIDETGITAEEYRLKLDYYVLIGVLTPYDADVAMGNWLSQRLARQLREADKGDGGGGQ